MGEHTHRSYAVWPQEVYTGEYNADDQPISYDDHHSESAAQAVCDMLERHGFGGNGPKPLHTWVEPITVDPDTGLARVEQVPGQLDIFKEKA